MILRAFTGTLLPLVGFWFTAPVDTVGGGRRTVYWRTLVLFSCPDSSCAGALDAVRGFLAFDTGCFTLPGSNLFVLSGSACRYLAGFLRSTTACSYLCLLAHTPVVYRGYFMNVGQLRNLGGFVRTVHLVRCSFKTMPATPPFPTLSTLPHLFHGLTAVLTPHGTRTAAVYATTF